MNNNTMNTNKKVVAEIKKRVFRELGAIKTVRPVNVNPGLKYLVR